MVRQQPDEFLADRAGGAEDRDGIRSVMPVAREQVRGEPHVQLDSLEQIGLPDVLVAVWATRIVPGPSW